MIHFPLHETDRLGKAPRHVPGPEGDQDGMGMCAQSQRKVVEKLLESFMWVAQHLPLAGRMKGRVLGTEATWMLTLRTSCRGGGAGPFDPVGKHMG